MKKELSLLHQQYFRHKILNKYLISFLILNVLLFSSCGPSREEREKAAAEKLEQEKINAELIIIEPINKKISNIFSSIEVGLNIIDYSNMLRGLKSEIDYIKPQLTVTELKRKIEKYTDVYNTLIDAHSLWKDEIDHANMHKGLKAFTLKTTSYKENKDDANTHDYFMKFLSEIIDRYDLTITEDEMYIENTGYTIITSYLYSRTAISKIWQEAAKKYAEI